MPLAAQGPDYDIFMTFCSPGPCPLSMLLEAANQCLPPAPVRGARRLAISVSNGT